MKKIVRLISFVLLMLQVLPLAVSCAKNGGDAETTPDTVETTESGVPGEGGVKLVENGVLKYTVIKYPAEPDEDTFNAIKNAIVNPITTAVNLVRTAINKIKSIINGAHLKLPKFKVPHFSVRGGKAPFGLGGKGSMPSISVKWYKQGGIFDNPSLVGIGEAGPEAVVPLSGSQMQPFAKAIADNMNGGGIDYERLGSVMAAAMQNAAFEAKLYIDGKELTTVIAPMMRKRINTLDNRDLRKQGVLVGV